MFNKFKLCFIFNFISGFKEKFQKYKLNNRIRREIFRSFFNFFYFFFDEDEVWNLFIYQHQIAFTFKELFIIYLFKHSNYLYFYVFADGFNLNFFLKKNIKSTITGVCELS